MTPPPVRRHYWDNYDKPHMVYVLLDGGGTALYVGQTYDLPHRLATHARREWWSEVAEIRATRHEDRGEAMAEERRLIDELDPLWNIQGTQIAADIAREGHRRRRTSA